MLPRLRNQHHDCQRQIHTGHGHKFQRIVQTGRVRTADIQHGENILHTGIQCLAVQDVFPAQHLVYVTSNGIDLTIVYHHAVRMRTLPAGVGIGTETGVHNTDCRMIIRTVQVMVEQAQLIYQEHALVYNGTAGTGNHIGFAVPLLKYHPCDIQLPVKFQTLLTVIRFFNKCLHNVRHAVQRFGTQHIRIYRHFTPAQEFQMFFLQHVLKGLHGLFIFFLSLREEEHGNSVFPLFTDGNSGFLCHL